MIKIRTSPEDLYIKGETLEMVICPVCGQKMCQVRYVNGVIMLRVQCRRCRNYIEVDLTGTK